MIIQKRLRVPSHFGMALLLFAFAFPKAVPAQVAVEQCGPLKVPMQYGPYDYRTDKDKLPIVEIAHFTSQVETLLRGQSGASFAGDISYTLQRFPNHHRALVSVMRMVERKMPAVNELHRPPECFFERAVRWRKDDVVARMLYAKFLSILNRKSEAIYQLEIADNYAENNPLTHRNIGFLLIEMKEFPRALAQAHKLLTLDAPDTRLRDALSASGHWHEPERALPMGAASAAPALEPAPAASAR